MRIVFVVAAALMLSACGTGDGWVPREGPAPQENVAPPARATPVESAPLPQASAAGATLAAEEPRRAPAPDADVRAHCEAIARQRAEDARANGFSLEMEQIVYQGTNKDCLNWHAQNGR